MKLLLYDDGDTVCRSLFTVDAAGHVARMGGMRSACVTLIVKRERKLLFERRKPGW